MDPTALSKSASVRAPLRAAVWMLSAGWVFSPASARAHGAQPRITSIVFPAPLQGAPLLITDTQGVFGYFGAEARWLCEDAIAPNANIVGVLATATPRTWLVASTLGVYLSTDDACTFARTAGLPNDVVPTVVSAHPLRPDELVMLASGSAGGAHYGVYRSVDGGRVFTGPALRVAVPWRTLLRDAEAPDRLYLSGDSGTMRSDDAGASWRPIDVAPDGEAVPPGGVAFLAVRPGADEVWAVVQRIPEAIVTRSADHGERWSTVTTVPDLVDRLVFDAAGDRALISTLYGGVARRDSPEGEWSIERAPAPGFGCLTRGPEPGDDTLHACADPFITAPWTLARSDDFGRTWQPELSALSAVTRRWACDAETPAVQACAELCPGVAPGTPCEPADAGPPVLEAGTLPAEPDPVRPPDAASMDDTGVVGPTHSTQGGCRAVPGRDAGRAPAWALLFVGLIRRRPNRRAPDAHGR